MKKFLFETFYIIDSLPNHTAIKPLLLNEISKISTNNSLVDDNNFISKLDWQSSDTNQKWKDIFLPYLNSKLLEIANDNGYKNIRIDELWFQQYKKNGRHGWHTHGSNFTGIYYLELPKYAPKTELILPCLCKPFTPDIAEGDILIFPSYVVHRAPIITRKLRKTIISFNFTMMMLTDIFLQSIGE